MTRQEELNQRTLESVWLAVDASREALIARDEAREVAATVEGLLDLQARGIQVPGVEAMNEETVKASRSNVDLAERNFDISSSMVGAVAMMDESPLAPRSSRELPPVPVIADPTPPQPGTQSEQLEQETRKQKGSIMKERMSGLVARVISEGGAIEKDAKESAGFKLRETAGLKPSQYGPASTALAGMGVLIFEKASAAARRVDAIRLDPAALKKAVDAGTLPEQLLNEANALENEKSLKADALDAASEHAASSQARTIDSSQQHEDAVAQPDTREELRSDSVSRRKGRFERIPERTPHAPKKPSEDLRRKIDFEFQVDGCRKGFSTCLKGSSFAELDDPTKLLLSVGFVAEKFSFIEDIEQKKGKILTFLNQGRGEEDSLGMEELDQLCDAAREDALIHVNGQGPQLTPFGLNALIANEQIRQLHKRDILV
ncbi:MAG: hypothetical protein U0524_00640 [Candidatus Saccharimonadales bacterium]